MGPMRQNWTFPVRGDELARRCKARETELIGYIDEALTDEQMYERELAEFRERLRQAGVLGWQTASMPVENTYRRTTGGDRQVNARSRYQSAEKKRKEIESYRRAIEFDLARDPDRLYKLTYDDLQMFGLAA